MNIKNYIFDLGNTVFEYIPENIVNCFYQGKNAELLEDVVFSRKYWDKLDDGTLSNEELKNALHKELPLHLHSYSDKICDNWQFSLPIINGMEELIQRLHDAGNKLYIISNISKEFAASTDKIPILKLFDDAVYSGVEGIIKPTKEIFEFAIERFRINPKESIFIDDSPININGAKSCGINGYLFDGAVDKLREYLSL